MNPSLTPTGPVNSTGSVVPENFNGFMRLLLKKESAQPVQLEKEAEAEPKLEELKNYPGVERFQEFTRANFNIDVNSLVCICQEGRDIAKQLPKSISSLEETIAKLEKRDNVIVVIKKLMAKELVADDKLQATFFETVESTKDEMKLKLSTMKEGLEHLKRLQKILEDNLGIGKNRLTCVICMDQKSEFMTAVCGHTCCRECSEKNMQSCHVCRGPTGWKRIFI